MGEMKTILSGARRATASASGTSSATTSSVSANANTASLKRLQPGRLVAAGKHATYGLPLLTVAVAVAAATLPEGSAQVSVTV